MATNSNQTSPDKFEIKSGKLNIKFKIPKLPVLVIFAGILFSLYLLWHIPDEIFFSGDGGLKFLLTKQFSAGNFRVDIDRAVEPWIRNLWLEGLYPFGDREPWIYYRDNLYYSPFPFTFSLVSAPFYALFGFRGLYIIPVVSLWSIWFCFDRVCQRLKLSSIISAVALTILIFASPLTFYGATFWEHTIAVALAFHGLAILGTPPSGELSKKQAIISGILIGLAVWFRGEFLCLIALLVLFTFASTRIKFAFDLILLLSAIIFCLFIVQKESSFWFIAIICLAAYASSHINLVFQKKYIFVVSMLLTVSLYWIINTIIYHHPLGIHALQVVEHLSLRGRISAAFKFFNSMSYDLFSYFPIIFLPIIYVILSLFNSKLRFKPQMKILFLVYILFSFSVPLLLPSEGGKQWGPRFLLILIPVISLLTVMIWQQTLKLTPLSLKYSFTAILFIFLAIGIYINTYQASVYLIQSYQPSKKLELLRKDGHQIVAVNHEFVSQGLVSVFNKKVFFLTKTPENLAKLSSALHKQGIQEFIYVCERFNPCAADEEETAKLALLTESKPLRIDFSKLLSAKGWLFKASISEGSAINSHNKKE